MFEVRATDLAGRIGRLRTKAGSIHTPAILPVVHPIRREVSPQEIKKLGFEAVMTNAYITQRQIGEEATKLGIHKILDFEGVVMTDSGGYQVLEYGKVDASPVDIARFEQRIGADIAITLDKPTGLNASPQFARETVEVTYRAAEESLRHIERHGILWSGPIQGGKFFDQVERSAKLMSSLRFDLYALGSPVEILDSYNFPLLVRMILAAKRNLPIEAPLHLFGAGHPLTMSLAVALGCDLFDSASYMLYARGDRYMTEYGTTRLQSLYHLSCSCPVCTSHTARELKGLAKRELVKALAVHNLHALLREMKSVHQAIEEGRLWDYTAVKARAHPNLWRAFRVVAEHIDLIEDGTPAFKPRALLLFDVPDHSRPEVMRTAEKLASNICPRRKRRLLVIPEGEGTPLYESRTYHKLKQAIPEVINESQVCFLVAPFGLVPSEICDVYPFSQYVSSLEPTGEIARVTLARALGALSWMRAKRVYFLDDGGKYSRGIRSLRTRMRASHIIKASDLNSIVEALRRAIGRE